MPQKTKADMQRDLEEARETVSRYYERIRELEGQISEGVESSPIYQQALRDAESARQERDLYRGMYTELADRLADQNRKRPMGRPVTITEDIREKVLQLHAEGLSIRKISEQTGISKSTVQRVCAGGGTE